MTIREIDTTNDGEITLCVTNWNVQAARINTPTEKVFDIWTPETCRLFLSLSQAHRMDDTNGTFVIATYDVAENEYDLVGCLRRRAGTAECMRAVVRLLPRGSMTRGDVSERASLTIGQYFRTRYSVSQHPIHASVKRYRATVENIESNA